MNVGRLVGGIVCLVLGALLVVLWFALPEGKVVFMVGSTNAPYIPAIALGLIGLALLGSARRR